MSEDNETPRNKRNTGFVMIRRDVLQRILVDLSDPARRVLFAICTFADATGRCFPSRESIAERAGVHPAHKVSYATAELAHAGYLDIVQTGKRKCNTYTVKKVMYLQRVHHLKGDVPLQGTGDVPPEGTSVYNETHITRKGMADGKEPSPHARKKSTKPTTPPSPIPGCLKHFMDLHEHHTGNAYVPQYGADGKQLKAALESITADDVKARMTRYFVRRDPWNEKNGYTVKNFCSAINGLAPRPGDGRSGQDDPHEYQRILQQRRAQ